MSLLLAVVLSLGVSPPVYVGSVFRVDVIVAAGPEFNGYQTDVAFDSLQVVDTAEGPYFPANCGLRYLTVDTSTRVVRVVHVLFCSGLSLSGPGNLFAIWIRAPAVAQTVRLEFRNTIVTNAGVNVPVETVGIDVIVEQPTDVLTTEFLSWSTVKESYRAR